MYKLIAFRKRTVNQIVGIITIVFLLSMFFFAQDVRQVFNTIKSYNAPYASNIEELNHNLKTKGASKIEVNFLEYTGTYYGGDDHEEIILSYTYFDEYFLVIIENTSYKNGYFFNDEDSRTITLYNNTVDRYKIGLEEVELEFSNYYDIDKTQMSYHFYDHLTVLSGFNQSTYIFLTYGILGTFIIVGIYLFLSNKVTKDLLIYLEGPEMDNLDIQLNNPIYEDKRMVLTEDYVVRKKGIILQKQVVKIEDIIWAFYKQNHYGIIPSRKTYSVFLFIKKMQQPVIYTIPIDTLDTFLSLLSYENPNIVFGYKDEYIKAWKELKNSDAFLDLFELKKTSMDDNDTLDR